MSTQLGKILKKARIDRGWVLKDMADAIQVSVAQLSHMERGRRKMDKKHVDQLSSVLGYNDIEKQQLIKATEESYIPSSIKLASYEDRDREVLYKFARKFQEMDDEQKNELKKLLGEDFD